MITIGTYIKIILKKRNMSQADLLRKMQELNLGKVDAPHLNNFINGTAPNNSYVWARRVEIALDLPEYSIIKMIGTPTEFEWKKIKEVGNNVSN